MPHSYTRVATLLLFLFLACTGAKAQDTKNTAYNTTYNGTNVTSVSITHKHPKWTQYHEGKGYNDTYNETDMVTLEKGKQVQAANTYVDTIYMHKGTTTTLILPYRTQNEEVSIYKYHRWYDYRTDGSFFCQWKHSSGDPTNNLLVPHYYDDDGMTGCRFANGYVLIDGGQKNNNGTNINGKAMSEMDFYYPTDEEYESMTFSDYFIKTDNNYYIVACDVSIYEDFKADNDGTEATFGADNDWCEPTLAGRALYYIIGVEDEGDNIPSGFAHYWHLLEEEYQGGVDDDGKEVADKKFLFEYEIDYPSRRFSANTAEMVALGKDANAYAIPGVSAEDDPEELDVTLIDEKNLGFNLAFSVSGNHASDITGSNNKGTISGNDRNIFFYKGTLGGLYMYTGTTVPTDTQWNVNDDDSITILVTKTVSGTTYNLVRYRIAFKETANLLTQTQVHGLSSLTDEEKEKYWWGEQTYRDSLYMETNYTQTASLTFDYDTSVNASTVFPNNAGSSSYYPFPKGWDTSGYAFYDGETAGVQSAGVSYSMYGITNDYIGYWDNLQPNGNGTTNRPPKNTAKDDSGYWLYIDASERPGEVAEIKLDGNLCQGSKLFGTAWVKGAGGATSVDAGLLFTLMGVSYEYNADSTIIVGERHTPLQRQCTGQFRSTLLITDNVNEPGLSSDVTGKGEETNEWFQVYFSFINEGHEDYDYYTVKVDNYCAGTNGGDYYFDELKMYVLQTPANVMQLDPICTDGGRSLVRLDLNYETIMGRIGKEPDEHTSDDDKETADLHLAIVNEYIYDTYLHDHLKGTETEDEEIEIKVAAILEAMVHFGNTDISETNYHSFPVCHLYLNYNLNKEYEEDNVGGNLFFYSDQYFYRRTDEGGERILCADMYSDMQAYTPYKIILLTSMDASVEQDDNDANSKYFAQYIDDHCTITAEFYLTSTTVLKVDGEVVDPTVDYCAGQIVEIAPEVTYNSYEEDETIVHTIPEGMVYFDWFFGTRDEYEEVNESFKDDDGEYAEGVSLHDALLEFRNYYPDAEVLSETETPVTGTFTQACYDIINYYLNKTRTGGVNNSLVLHSTNLSVRILNTGIALIIQPIGTTLYLDASGEPVKYDPDNPDATSDDLLAVCFGYVPLMLEANGDAPQLNAGFSNIEYPNGELIPSLRMGLKQMQKTSSDTPITVNLRDASYVAEKDEEGTDIEVDHLGRVTSADGLDYLFLIDTDDPEYIALIDSVETSASGEEERLFTQYSLPIGRIKYLYANSDPTATDTRNGTPDIGSYMQVYFYNDEATAEKEDGKVFNAKEGYYYVVNVHFEEKGKMNDDGTSEAVGTACQGEIPLTIKIVPEYLVWQGDRTANWNNDNHWQRVSSTSIKATEDESSPYFTDGNDTTYNGFVPMLFTKVVMPRDSEAELYMAGFIEGTVTDDTGETSTKLIWKGDDVATTDEGDGDSTTTSDVPEHPTPYIMYDLMVYETQNALTTEHYRVNLCDELHLEPGAQLLHSEQLLYNKVWTDVELAQGPWTLVATPLRDVVSGDWYTKKETGTETAEYFTDITFDEKDGNGTALNDRLAPMVYQRNWSNSGNTIVYTDEAKGTSKEVPAYASTGWSSVYNDVSVSHQAGEGFSIKASRTVDADTKEPTSAGSLMFRFPKADASYTYQDGSSTDVTTVDRTYAGQLRISALVDRTDPDEDDDSVYKQDTILVVLTQTENDYYIIGNPYTAHMSMAKFLEENTQFAGYWLESTYGPMVGTMDGTSWGTDDCLIPPYSAFFVKKAEKQAEPTASNADPVTVTFTKDMQVLVWDEDDTGDNTGDDTGDVSPVRRQIAFAVRAESERGTTSAAIAYSADATDDFRAGEDAVLMEDVAWKRDGMPLVYTVAGDKAVSVNSLKQLTLIPIGVFADEGSLYTLSFAGVSKLDNPALVDTYEDTETPITEDLTLEVEGPTHGRYYIKVGATTADDVEMEEEVSKLCEVSAYSPVQHTVVVSCDAGLGHVEIYSVGGMLLKNASAGGSLSCTINGVPSGIAIVRVKTTEDRTLVRKLIVK